MTAEVLDVAVEANQQPPEPLAVAPRKAALMIGVSVPTLYALLNAGRVHSVRAGGRRLVSVRSLRAFIDGDQEAE